MKHYSYLTNYTRSTVGILPEKNAYGKWSQQQGDNSFGVLEIEPFLRYVLANANPMLRKRDIFSIVSRLPEFTENDGGDSGNTRGDGNTNGGGGGQIIDKIDDGGDSSNVVKKTTIERGAIYPRTRTREEATNSDAPPNSNSLVDVTNSSDDVIDVFAQGNRGSEATPFLPFSASQYMQRGVGGRIATMAHFCQEVVFTRRWFDCSCDFYSWSLLCCLFVVSFYGVCT
jgi:hypothetical protein